MKQFVVVGRTRSRRTGAGFSLVELMIAVAIFALSLRFGMPAYGDWIASRKLANHAEYLVETLNLARSEAVKRGKIIEATSGLSDLRQGMEQYFLDNRTYVGYCASPSGTARVQPTVPAFVLTCVENVATYTLTATGVPAQGMAAAFVYTVDQSGAKASAGPAGWAGNPNCWAVRKSGECT